MKLTILTLFPDVFAPILSSSILGRAQKRGQVEIAIVNIRDFAKDRHKTVDDRPYGGGPGMLLRVDVLVRALRAVKRANRKKGLLEKVILLDPTGTLFTQVKARQFARLDHLILLCGHYEGFDVRIVHFVDERISIGRFILTGGEIPAMVVLDSVVRLIPGVLTKKEATKEESYTRGNIVESPAYTHPREFEGLSVPKVLLSGNHETISKWREKHRHSKRFFFPRGILPEDI